MFDEINAIARVVSLNGGELIGKTRLQKSIYFMEALGVGFGFDFDYHHYGPYSEEVSDSASMAQIVGLLNTKSEIGSYGVPYAVYSTSKSFDQEELDGRRTTILNILKKFDAISVELAATAHFLYSHGYEETAWDETATRKASKANANRLAMAKALLQRLELPPQ